MSRSTSTDGVRSQVRQVVGGVVGLAERDELVRVHQLQHGVEVVVARRSERHAGTSSSSVSGNVEAGQLTLGLGVMTFAEAG